MKSARPLVTALLATTALLGSVLPGHASPSTVAATQTSTTAPVVSLRAGTGTTTTVAGVTWSADRYFVGGTASTTTGTVSGTPTPELYRTIRYGMTGYDVPVTDGTYTVTLKLVENYFTAKGKRVFDVSVEGRRVLSSFDIFATAGRNAAVDRTFTVEVADGRLDIDFRKVVNNASVAAIQVAPTAGAPAPVPAPVPVPVPAPVPAPAPVPNGPVVAKVETVDLPKGSGDIADDTAIWVDPVTPSRSLVIGTSKASSGGGIAVYDLAGKQLQFRADGKFNNVDLRSGMTLAGRQEVVVATSNRTVKGINFYRVDPGTRQVQPIGARVVPTGVEPYGLCMYRSRTTGKLFVFVTQADGPTTDQYELFERDGKVDAKKVRSLPVGGMAEGCVADDEHGVLYLAEEDRGVWRYGAEPAAGTARSSVGSVGDGRLKADVEGMAIADRGDGEGYLIVSSQGNDTYAVYDRVTGRWVRSFSVGGSGSVDGVSDTDGVAATTAALGSAFPRGLLVLHDNANSGGRTSNYKLVDLSSAIG